MIESAIPKSGGDGAPPIPRTAPPTAASIVEAIRSAVRGVRPPPAGAFPRLPPAPDGIFVIDDKDGDADRADEEEDLDEVSLVTDNDGDRDEAPTPQPQEIPGDEVDETASAAFEAVRLLESSGAGAKVSASSMVALLHAAAGGESCRLSREEARVAVRMAYRLARQNSGIVPSVPTPPAMKTSEAMLVELASDRSLPWYVREEALQCLSSRGAGGAGPGSPLNPNPALDWKAVLSLVEGGPCKRDDAAVRSAALRVVVSRGHRPALGRLRAMAAARESEPEPRGPVPGWHDCDRQVQLARAALGDVSMLVTAVVRCYDPEGGQRAEARGALQAAAQVFGEGMVGVARRIVAEDDLVNERGEVPELGGDRRRVWRFLKERHWNECVVRWAGEQLKEEEIAQKHLSTNLSTNMGRGS